MTHMMIMSIGAALVLASVVANAVRVRVGNC